MHELIRPFARIHVLGLVLIGCLALAVLTGEALWGWFGLGAGTLGALWWGVRLYRDQHRPPT